MNRSDLISRFAARENLELTSREANRIEIQRDIDAWLAAGNTIQLAPPLEIKPRPPHRGPPAVSVPRKYYRWTEAEIEMVRELKAQGYSHRRTADLISAKFGTKRTRATVETLCSMRGIRTVKTISSAGRALGATESDRRWNAGH